MKEIYPRRETISDDYLVARAEQPDFLWSESECCKQHWNAATESVDAVVDDGMGAKPALVSLGEGRTWTYGDLKRESDHLAGAMVELGLQIGDRVAIFTPSGGNHIVTVLAVWKAGGAIVPLPQQSRADDLRVYLEDTAPRFVVGDGQSHFATELAAAVTNTSCVEKVIVNGHDSERMLPRAESLEALINCGDPGRRAAVRTQANDLACVWHTGGTTGRPKATYHTHRRWVVASRRLKATWGLGSEQVWLHAMPMGNVAGTLGRFLQVLNHGGTLVEPERLSPEGLFDGIQQAGVTDLLGVSVTLGGLADIVGSAGGTSSIPSLSRVYAPMLTSRDVYDAWEYLGYQLANPYGNSVLCEWAIGPTHGETTPAFALGRPAAGYECRIVAVDGGDVKDLPAGETGRIAIRGATGATYWRRDDLQALEVRHGWTVTDDLGSKDGGGNVWFMGRLNDLIVTAGFKVSPGEVEDALLRHPMVTEVKATGLQDPRRGEIVGAFVALRAGVSGTPSLARELQEWAKQETAPYKYPRVIVFYEKLPRDALGKVQTRAMVEEYLAGRMVV